MVPNLHLGIQVEWKHDHSQGGEISVHHYIRRRTLCPPQTIGLPISLPWFCTCSAHLLIMQKHFLEKVSCVLSVDQCLWCSIQMATKTLWITLPKSDPVSPSAPSRILQTGRVVLEDHPLKCSSCSPEQVLSKTTPRGLLQTQLSLETPRGIITVGLPVKEATPWNLGIQWISVPAAVSSPLI